MIFNPRYFVFILPGLGLSLWARPQDRALFDLLPRPKDA